MYDDDVRLAGRLARREGLDDGNHPAWDLMGDAAYRIRTLADENAKLRQQVAGHCERIAKQSDLLTRRAEVRGVPPTTDGLMNG